MSSDRLERSVDFLTAFGKLDYSKQEIVRLAIQEIEEGKSAVTECPGNTRRYIEYCRCRLYFRNDSLLQFKFLDP